MNCTSFQDLVFEYLDGELSPEEQAWATEHLAGCSGCRSLLEHERATGNQVSKVFRGRTAELRLSEGFEGRVLKAVESARPVVAERTFEGILAFARRFGWVVAAGAGAIVVAAVLLVRGHTESGEIVQSGGEEVQATVPVQAAFVSAVYTFRVEGDRVVDVLEYRTNVVDGAVLVSRN